MRWLINYIRKLFCQHEFEIVRGQAARVVDHYHTRRSYFYHRHPVFYHLCKKCGYSEQYWG